MLTANSLEMKTIRPQPRSFIRGRWWRQSRTPLMKLTSMIRRQSSSGMASKSFGS